MAVCLDYQSVYVKNVKTQSHKLLIVACLFLMSVLIFHVWIRATKVTLGYQIAKAQHQTLEYKKKKKDLAMQASVIKRYDNLMGLAKTRLGYTLQEKPRILTLEY